MLNFLIFLLILTGPFLLIVQAIVSGLQTGTITRILSGSLLGAIVLIGAELLGSTKLSLPFICWDSLSKVLYLLVAFLGWIVSRYSENYLEGNPHQPRFMRWLGVTLGCVLFLVISGHLLTFTLFWIGVSLSLHQLLVFYGYKTAAAVAARKKFLISRLGDLAMIGVCLLSFRLFGSLEFEAIFSRLRTDSASVTSTLSFHLLTFLLVMAAVMKSAQIPFHSWLPETMETPTPVSALMHAGIINAGGFLLIRMSPVLQNSLPALSLLVIFGAVTAILATLMMLTQTSIKKSLAYSTIGQMGFMILECGLGIFTMAVVHMVAHSFYKAHAFLSTGSVVEISKSSWNLEEEKHQSPRILLILLMLSTLLVWSLNALKGGDPFHSPGESVLASILSMSLVHLLWNGSHQKISLRFFLKMLLLSLGIGFLTRILHSGSMIFLGDSVAQQSGFVGVPALVLSAITLVAFALILVFQTQLPGIMRDPRIQRVYVHLYNGFYLNALLSRSVERYWPPKSKPLDFPIQ